MCVCVYLAGSCKCVCCVFLQAGIYCFFFRIEPGSVGIKVLSDNSPEPRPCVSSKRANFQPWQALPKFLGRRALSERGEQIKGGRSGRKGVWERRVQLHKDMEFGN